MPSKEPGADAAEWTRLGPTLQVSGDFHGVVCSYCMQPVKLADRELVTISVTQGHNPKPRPDRNYFGHLECLIASLHEDRRASWAAFPAPPGSKA